LSPPLLVSLCGYFSGICETNQAIIAMKTIARIDTTNITRPGMTFVDPVSPASARASGKRQSSEPKRIAPAL
jgi:hypothetical protein